MSLAKPVSILGTKWNTHPIQKSLVKSLNVTLQNSFNGMLRRNIISTTAYCPLEIENVQKSEYLSHRNINTSSIYSFLKKIEPDGEIGRLVSTKKENDAVFSTSEINYHLPYPSEKVSKSDGSAIIKKLFTRPLLKKAAQQNGINDDLFSIAKTQYIIDFNKMCNSESQLQDCLLHIKDDLGHVDDLFPHFLNYCHLLFPVLGAAKELKVFSDLSKPEEWFPLARSIKRKIIFHAGPTNSGKTYHALKMFFDSKTGIYCGPLRMLVAEIADKAKEQSVECDMLTGEERLYAVDVEHPSNHTSCTVEMCNTTELFDCAVIDEIQMLRDPTRGAAWTKAFLGVAATEVHVCGEQSAIDLVRKLTELTGDELEIQEYQRLTSLTLLPAALESLDNVEKGDCVISFSQRDLFRIRRKIEKQTGLKCALIYGSLPPSVRLQQAKYFNDPDNDHTVLVASDAVGMGINLNIRRIIFNRLEKFDGQSVSQLTPFHAKQISGRAGRFGSVYNEGFVTTLDQDDLNSLKELLSQPNENVKQAGILPTFDHLEMMAYQLPKIQLNSLWDVFEVFATIEDDYFLCQLDDMKRVAEATKHIKLNLWQRYTFCQAPADKVNSPFVLAILVKFARLVSKGNYVTCSLLRELFDLRSRLPKTLQELQLLESYHKSTDVYLWLSHRFPELFCDGVAVNEMQDEIEEMILQSVTTDLQSNQSIKNNYQDSKHVKGDQILNTGADSVFKLVDKSFAKKYGSKAASLISSGQLTVNDIKSIQREWHSKGKGIK